MKLGFSSLALFRKPINEILEIATNSGFDIIEFLCEGPSSPWYLLENKNLLEVFKSYDLGIYLHSPTVDLNLASINKGIREESIRQTKECLDLANEIGAIAITAHPGKVGRKEEKLREVALRLATESTHELVDYSENMDVKVSIENMPERFSFLCNKVEELENIVQATGCSATIDLGHANTCNNSEKFTEISNIAYYHLNDNNGEKDQHTSLGDGTLDLNLLKKVNNGIIELNNYDNVLKTKKVIEDFLD